MASTTIVYLIDDLTGGEASETIRFSLDKTDYEIDLNQENAADLRASLSRYQAAGRRIGGGARPQRRSAANGSTDNDKIRQWAIDNGHSVAARGRIPERVRDAFHQAQ